MDFIEEFRNSLSSEAEHLVHRSFPDKVEAHDKLLSTKTFGLGKLEHVRKSCMESFKLATQKLKPGEKASNDSETILLNEAIVDAMEVIHSEITTLMQSCSVLRLWVTLLLPQIEDGNNFGVSVQEEAMNEIKAVECEATSLLGQIFGYYASRAKIAAKILKYPQVKDYARYLVEEDERQFVNLRLILIQMRNSYSSIHDLVMKNLEKIKTPKSGGFSALY